MPETRAAVEEWTAASAAALGGVDDSHAGGDGVFDQGAQQGVVGAAEDQSVGVEALGGGLGGEFVEIDADDLGGDGHLR